MNASSGGSLIFLAADQGTGGRGRGERKVVVASVVLFSPACMECLVLRMQSTGLHFPVPRYLLLCYLHIFSVRLPRCPNACTFVQNGKEKRISMTLHMTDFSLSSFSLIEEGAETGSEFAMQTLRSRCGGARNSQSKQQ